MKILESPEIVRARQLYSEEWAKKHPGTPPPALYPEYPNDPIWVEADTLMDECLVKAQAEQVTSAFGTHAQGPTWVAMPGGYICPNNHWVSITHTHCPDCGAGPVSVLLESEAQEATAIVGIKGEMVWAAMQRQ